KLRHSDRYRRKVSIGAPTWQEGGQMEIWLLGPLEIRPDDTDDPIPVPFPQVRQGIVLLAVAPGQSLTQAQLIERLWDSPPRNAASSVSTLMSRARDALGDRLLSERGRGFYSLALRPGDKTDFATFRKLLRLGQNSAVAAGGVTEAVQVLTEALKL